MTIDAAELHFSALNAQVRSCEEERVNIRHCIGQRYIAAGLSGKEILVEGTPGNGGVINTNPPLLPADDEFIVYLDQVNDQMMIFPELSKEYIPIDVMSKKIGSYSNRVAMDRSASTLAEIIAYAFFRSLNDGENLVNQGDLTQENAYANLINDLNAKLDNGDPVRGAFTFPTEGRTVIGRPKFINGLFNRNSGVIMLGGDLAQEMLRNYDLNVRMADRNYVGTGY